MDNDYEAIRKLSYAYTFRLDSGDFDGVAELLSDAGLRPEMRGVAADVIQGREPIRRFYADQVVLYQGDPRTRHIISNHVIDVEGEHASGKCYFTVLMKPPGEPYQIVLGGEYRDRFLKVHGEWRFVEKTIKVDYINDVGRHFKIAQEHH